MASPSEPELDALRREVDRIDRATVELLAERLHVVRSIAALKQKEGAGRPAIRPGREAAILRRLVAQAGPRFPTATLVRMWRELLAATTRVQAPLSVVACVLPGGPELWDLARDHFGSAAPVRRATDGDAALRLVADGEADLVVLPLPAPDMSWWTGLADPPLRIVARLPFVRAPHDHGALVVGAFAPDPSGDDLTLLALDTAAGHGAEALCGHLRAGGLAARPLAAALACGRSRHLLEVEGFLEPHDARLAAVAGEARGPVLRCAWLGGYARPLAVGG